MNLKQFFLQEKFVQNVLTIFEDIALLSKGAEHIRVNDNQVVLKDGKTVLIFDFNQLYSNIDLTYVPAGYKPMTVKQTVTGAEEVFRFIDRCVTSDIDIAEDGVTLH